MNIDKALSIAAPAAGAYLGVTAAGMVKSGGIVGALVGIAGAALGLYIAAMIAGKGK